MIKLPSWTKAILTMCLITIPIAGIGIVMAMFPLFFLYFFCALGIGIYGFTGFLVLNDYFKDKNNEY